MHADPATDLAKIPDWSRQLADIHAQGASQMFLLHGNVHDLIRVERRDAAVTYTMLPEFLASRLFGTWDSVLYYDQVRGPRPLANNPARLEQLRRHAERFVGALDVLRDTRSPAMVFDLLDRYLERVLLAEGERPAVALILDYAHFLAPSTGVAQTSREVAGNLATLLNWARSPYFKKVPFAFCLISERLGDLHDALVQNAHTTRIEIPFPNRRDRLEYLSWMAAGRSFADLCEVPIEALADLSAGLTLVHLQGLMQGALRTGTRIGLDTIRTYKKHMIEGQCRNLVEFIEPPYTLDMVVGNEAAKARLRQDADLLRRGHLDAVPMGYLFCGPVGTGKTYLAECYAGSVGIPCVKLLNFRSKYVGETEGNLEHVLRVLRVMGPVAVVIDEADAMLGDRETSGDSGTSSRVFGQFASQMGDTRYRGRILWFLLTCRPDLLPIDLKRQGRCEVHIPLFHPVSREEVAQMFVAMARKHRMVLLVQDAPVVPDGMRLSGADIEGVVTRARRLALVEGVETVTAAHVQAAMDQFIPSAETAHKTLQELAAVIECTDAAFLPPDYRAAVSSAEGRNDLVRRFEALVRML